MDWIKKNAWNLIGTTIGVIGIVTGYLFYRASIQFPSLSFFDSKPHSLVMNYGAVSDSPVRLLRKDGSPVAQSVYTARLYLWNSGTVSLRRDSILKPLNIEAEGCEILDAKVAKVSRPDVTKLSVAMAHPGAIGIVFDILEPTDGLTLTVLYAAPQPASFYLDGVVEGVKSFAPAETLPTGDIALRTTWRLIKGVSSILLVMLVFAALSKSLEWLGKISVPVKNWIGNIIVISAVVSTLILVLYGLIGNAYKNAVGAQGFIPPALTK
ncbi:MAG TPA: hypothetical protein VK717_05195 [Opitutaceae bacterium]|jgi:hypothetical protein|nr:hypothetical protein [Opitutaceae bacterium]